MTQTLKSFKRVVVKIGSSLLVDPQTGIVRRDWLNSVVEDVVHWRARGQQVLIVSSGAIALGRHALKLPAGVLRLEQAQAAAAAGQIRLAHAYEELFAAKDIPIAQVLLTLDDTEERRRYLNARATIDTILKSGGVPVINENDTVTTEEIRYGDNDRLGARVAQMVGADGLVLLSDVDGLYSANPSEHLSATLIPRVETITADIEKMARPAGEKTTQQMGSGGMVTKIEAAKIAVNAGCHMVIASGRILHSLRAIEEGAPCTWFTAKASPAAARKQWISGRLKPQGSLTIDGGAEKALLAGKSLLPAGIMTVSGTFGRGDAVRVLSATGQELARGLVAYGSLDAGQIAGHKSQEIENILGYRGRDEMIHRDDLVLTNRSDQQTNLKEATA